MNPLQPIIGRAAAEFGCSADALLAPDRTAEGSWRRHVVAYVAHEQGLSFPRLARALGWKNHTTALNAVRRVRDEMDVYPGRRAEVDRIAAAVQTTGPGGRT